ncbi:MAG: thiolase family protein [Deltaproteobacteria bacterium]|nr:thiolase family protein [Deltaproteobacteria bacterium]MBW2179053.1 thiolase family protein [Deltaproteobacteria bacterium]
MKTRNVVIVDGVRSAFTKGGRGRLEATRMDEAGAALVRMLFERNPKIKPTMIEEFGVANSRNDIELAELGFVSRLAGLPVEVPNFYSNRHCASSMEVALRIGMAIMLGQYDCGIAFGAERMTRVMGAGGATPPPPTRVTGFNLELMNPSQMQRDMPEDYSDYFKTPIPDYLLDVKGWNSMVQTAQNVAEMYDLSREDLDEFSMKSQQRLAAANDEGMYKDEVMPLEVEDPVFDENGNWNQDEIGPKVILDRDESVRGNTTMEGLAKLGPVKGIQSYGGQELRITAGNSCPTNSGISVVLLMAEEKALKLGLEPLARIIGWGNAGVKQCLMGIGPVPSIVKALKHAGLEAGQIDRVEFNEAFACQVIATLREIGIPNDKVNVNGGSIGIGHPIGATGGRLLMTVAKELRRSGQRYGLATQCIGAGQGATTVLEALD